MKRFFPVYDRQVLLFFLLVIATMYSIVAVMTHRQFLTFGWDLGFFDQLIWKVSRFSFPFSSLTKVNLLANHFSPILFFLGPLYWISLQVEMLLIIQAIVMVGTALPLYFISKHETRHIGFSFAVVFSYLFFIGTQWSILNEFHEATFSPLFIALVYYGLLDKRLNRWFWVGLVGLMFIKEEFYLLTASIGLTLVFHLRQRKFGLGIFIFSIAAFFFLTHVFMPAISEKGNYQHAHLSSVAQTPGELVVKLISDPIFIAQSAVNPPAKIVMVVSSLAAFAFLPTFAPFGMVLPLVEQFAMRILYTGPQFTVWQNVNHHAAPAAILLAILSVYGAKFVVGRFKSRKCYIFLGTLLLFVTIIQDIYYHGPVHALVKPSLYRLSPWMKDTYAVIDKVPPHVEIAAQNSLIPHLSQRDSFYLLPEIGSAEYIIVDLHDGPNKFAPYDIKNMKILIQKLVDDQNFVLLFQQGDALLLKRKEL